MVKDKPRPRLHLFTVNSGSHNYAGQDFRYVFIHVLHHSQQQQRNPVYFRENIIIPLCNQQETGFLTVAQNVSFNALFILVASINFKAGI